MKTEFQEYLTALQVSSVVLKRVDKLIELLHEIIPFEFSAIFLSDFITQDGTMQFDTLYLFSDKFILQARNFLQMDNFEIGALKECISTIEIQEQDYDFITTSEKSRLTILANLAVGPRMYQFKGSRENCRYLKNIYDSYIQPNLGDISIPTKVIVVNS
jgi:hypothetical protein